MSLKMTSHIMWVTFIVAVHLSAVWGRNQFYEYYYSRYHHKTHSTTTAIPLSTAGDSTEVQTVTSVSDGDSMENVRYSSTVDFEPTKHKNGTIHSYRYNFDNDVQAEFTLKVGIIVGVSVVFLVAGCCLFCCIRICRRRNATRSGFIIADRTPGAPPAVYPQQPIMSLPPGIAHQYPPPYQEERAQLFPPQYQPQIMQQQQHQQYAAIQQSQYSPTAPSNHNPPEAPPPYEFPEKF